MSKNERLALLVRRAAELGIIKLAAPVVPVTREEIREAAKEVVAKVSAEMNDETREEEEIGFKSELKFDSAKTREEREEDCLLTAKEKAQLRREWSQRQVQFAHA